MRKRGRGEDVEVHFRRMDKIGKEHITGISQVGDKVKKDRDEDGLDMQR